MSSIIPQIEEILAERSERLREIEARIASLESVRERIKPLDALVKQVRKEIERGEGENFDLFTKDPEVGKQFDQVFDKRGELYVENELRALSKLNEVIEELKKLKIRFSRDRLRVAFIGFERMGKSTFIRTITGLDNKVIPAYNGDSCTGAVSVIHNEDTVLDPCGQEVKVRVEVAYYDRGSFLEVVNSKLERFFPDGRYRISELNDLPSLELPNSIDSKDDGTKLGSEYIKFKESVVDHYNEYSQLLGKGIEVFCDEDKIALTVAQYEQFDHQVEGSEPKERNGRKYWERKYYNYVAVKSVDIYKKFDVETTKKLELVDTIGIGSAADSEEIREEMYRVLREDCDAAINVFRPDTETPKWEGENANLLDDISRNLKGLDPSKWIIYVLNSGKGLGNIDTAKDVLKKVKDVLDVRDDNAKPVAWVKAIDGSNIKEVGDEMVTPLLTLIANNLKSLDDARTDSVKDISREAYDDCLNLIRATNNVTSASTIFDQDTEELFKKLFEEMKGSFVEAMNDLSEEKENIQDKKCDELEKAYQKIITTIAGSVPSEEKIKDDFEKGIRKTENESFEEYVEQIRCNILDVFEQTNSEVLSSVVSKVQNELSDILYNKALLKNLPSAYDSPSIEWFRRLIDEYIDTDKAKYKKLYEAFVFIRDYHISIESSVEYDVARSLDTIEKTNRWGEFIHYPNNRTASQNAEKASNVWQQLCNRLPVLQNKLRGWIGNYVKIPNHSQYIRVHKFYLKLLSNPEGLDDLERFFRKHKKQIWSNEFNTAGKIQQALSKWDHCQKSLEDVLKSEMSNFYLD